MYSNSTIFENLECVHNDSPWDFWDFRSKELTMGDFATQRSWLLDGYSQISRSYVFGPSGFWTMAQLRYTAKFDPFLSLDCAPTPSTLAQSKERKGSNFAIWQPCQRFTQEKKERKLWIPFLPLTLASRADSKAALLARMRPEFMFIGASSARSNEGWRGRQQASKSGCRLSAKSSKNIVKNTARFD